MAIVIDFLLRHNNAIIIRLGLFNLLILKYWLIKYNAIKDSVESW